MKKGLYWGIIAGAFLTTTAAQATEGLSQTYEFYPNIPTQVENPLFWTLDTLCTISTPDERDSLTGKMMRKTASLNGSKLKTGESMVLDVHHADVLHIRADYGAKIQITNHGYSLVKAECKI